MKRGRWLALGTAVAVAALVLLVVQRHRRAQEWAHGGDAVTLLVPTGFTQAIVVRLDWRGPAPREGWYHLIALDRRFQPPQPLQVYDGWNAQGATGSGWAGIFLVDGHALPFTNTAQVLVAVFRVDEHSEVRWARRVAG